MYDRQTRRPGTARDAAESAFKAATAKPAAVVAAPKAPLPAGKELVSIRLDREVLERFQSEGPGWQERINAALRASAGLA